MLIELTAEQRLALQTHPEGPLAVIDPQSRREYVLLSREEYERVRPPLTKPPMTFTPPPPRQFTLPVKIADLPTPPEVTADAKLDYQRWWNHDSLAAIEEERKLPYYFGGKAVCCLRAKGGLVVVAVYNGDDVEYHRQVKALTPEQQRNVFHAVLPVWQDDPVEILTPFHSEDDH